MRKFARCVGSRARWEKIQDLEPKKDFSSDALGDVKTSGQVLSVFLVNEETDVNLIGCALASGRGKLDLIDFVLFEESVFSSLGMSLVRTDGNTVCGKANELHFDVANISGLTLPQFVSRVIWEGAGTVRMKKEQVKAELRKLLVDGTIVPGDGSPEWLKTLHAEVGAG